MKQNKYLEFDRTDESNTNLYIYGEIKKPGLIEQWFGIETPNIDALSLKDALGLVDTPNLTVRINSHGGSVAEGLAIYNQLKSFPGEITTIVDGFACSIASVIFMAGTKRVVPESSLLMIHNAWSSTVGDHNDMTKAAEDLKKITQPSINIYTSSTNLSEKEVIELMDKESWLTSQECYDFGFATTIQKSEANQSLEDQYFYNMVMKVKELESMNARPNEPQMIVETESSNWNGFFNAEKG